MIASKLMSILGSQLVNKFMICPKCKQTTRDDSKFCQNCGFKIKKENIKKEETKKCPHCGKEINAGALKCKHCDKWIDGKNKEYEGIGGWLILPTIGILFSSVIWAFSLFVWASELFSDESGAYEFFFFAASIAMLSLLIYCLILEFKKKKEFPKLIIITLWLGVIITIVISAMDNDFTDAGREFFGAVIWTSYFNASKRVKNTFVN